jgi:hypothetical protein
MGVGESEGGLRFEEELSPFDGVRTGESPLPRSGALSFQRTRSFSSIGIFLYLEERPTGSQQICARANVRLQTLYRSYPGKGVYNET